MQIKAMLKVQEGLGHWAGMWVVCTWTSLFSFRWESKNYDYITPFGTAKCKLEYQSESSKCEESSQDTAIVPHELVL